jgi:hypothetical protein
VTDEKGHFRIDSLPPGRYLLGVNLTGSAPSRMPTTYFPGTFEQAEAMPIDVKLGGSVSDLRFILPDFGKERQIEVCVVDATGKGVASVRVLSVIDEINNKRATLGETLVTAGTGCVTAAGYAKVEYTIRGSTRSYTGEPSLNSDPVVIEPGDAPAHVRLVLKQAK